MVARVTLAIVESLPAGRKVPRSTATVVARSPSTSMLRYSTVNVRCPGSNRFATESYRCATADVPRITWPKGENSVAPGSVERSASQGLLSFFPMDLMAASTVGRKAQKDESALEADCARAPAGARARLIPTRAERKMITRVAPKLTYGPTLAGIHPVSRSPSDTEVGGPAS